MGDSTCLSRFGDGETSALKSLTLVASTLSVSGSSFILGTYLVLPATRTFAFTLVAWLAFADFFASVSYWIGLRATEYGYICSTTFSCYLEGIMSQYFDVATFLWTGVIAHNIHAVLVHQRMDTGDDSAILRKYHVFVWGVSLSLMLIVASTRSLGESGLWCWIVPEQPLVQFFCYYIVLLGVFAYNTTVFISIFLHIRHDASSLASATVITYRLTSYLTVFALVRCWSVIDRFHNAVVTGPGLVVSPRLTPTNGRRLTRARSNDPSFPLALFHAFFSPLQGFCNAIVYGMNRSVVSEWRAYFHRHRRRHREIGKRLRLVAYYAFCCCCCCTTTTTTKSGVGTAIGETTPISANKARSRGVSSTSTANEADSEGVSGLSFEDDEDNDDDEGSEERGEGQKGFVEINTIRGDTNVAVSLMRSLAAASPFSAFSPRGSSSSPRLGEFADEGEEKEDDLMTVEEHGGNGRTRGGRELFVELPPLE